MCTGLAHSIHIHTGHTHTHTLHTHTIRLPVVPVIMCGMNTTCCESTLDIYRETRRPPLFCLRTMAMLQCWCVINKRRDAKHWELLKKNKISQNIYSLKQYRILKLHWNYVFFFSLRNHFTYSIFTVCVLFFINLGKILTVIKEKVFCSNSANKYNIHSSGGVNVVFQL